MNYYFDMDGVLALYEREAYEGKSALYMMKGMHYYRNVKPDDKMLNVIRMLNSNIHEKPTSKIYILTSLSNQGYAYLEQYRDKVEWCKQYLPFIDTDKQFIACVSSKRETIQELTFRDRLSYSDILIDDYNNNLIGWQDAHGTAIKYCNGINSNNSFNGLNLTVDMSAYEIVDVLLSINKSLKD